MGLLFKELKKKVPEEHGVIMHCCCNIVIQWQNSSKTPSYPTSDQECFSYLTTYEAKCWVSNQFKFSVLKIKEIKPNTHTNTAKPDIK